MKCLKIIIILIIHHTINNFSLSAQTYFDNIFFSVPSAVCKAALDKGSNYHNPSVISDLDDSQASLKFAPMRYGMSELSPASIALIHKLLSNLTGGVHLSGISNRLYTELAASVSSGIELSNILKCGINFELSNISIKNYGTQYALRVDAGGLLDLSETISAGFVIKNLTRDYYKGATQTALMNALFGFGFRTLDNLYFDIDASIVFNHSSGIAIAGLYDFNELLFIRAAFLTNPRSLEIGAKINALNYLSISGLVNYHDILGYSFQGGLYYIF